LLLPALSKSKFRAKVINCTSNYKQWVQMANIYASDDAQGSMPSFYTSMCGGNPTDVATNFLTNLMPYGFTVPMFFCPARTADLDNANAWFYTYGVPSHRYIQSVTDLNQWFSGSSTKGTYPIVGRSVNGGYAKLLHDWWVPRRNSGSPPGPVFPASNPPAKQYTPDNVPPWPLKTSDTSMALQPIISDLAETTAGDTTVDDIPNVDAHFYNGSLNSINVGYADNHVETHNRLSIAWQYTSQSSYFY
jgi:hypothetical protein